MSTGQQSIGPAVLLSTFDVIIGPSIKVSVPALEADELETLTSVTKLIDVADEEEFFISTLGNIYSANYYFIIPFEGIRGKKQLLLLTIALNTTSIEKIDDALGFLERQKPLLLKLSKMLKQNPRFLENGIFHESNERELKGILHEVYEKVFGSPDFRHIIMKDQGKVFVASPIDYDPRPEIHHFKKLLNEQSMPDLKTRMVQHIVDELNFVNFKCEDRMSGTCKLDACPACNAYVLDSDAVIFIFDSTQFDMERDFTDMVNYIKNVDASKKIPFFILQLDGSKSKVLEPFSEKLQVAIKKHSIENEVLHFQIEKNSIQSFKLVMSDLIKYVV